MGLRWSVFSVLVRFIRRFWWALGLLLLLGLYFAYSNWQKQQKALADLETVAAEKRDVVKTLSFSGRIDARQKVSLRFAAAGKLVSLPVVEGQSVKKGQLLALIDPRTAEKTLEKTLSLYQTERWDFENAQDDRKDRTLPKDEQRAAEQDQFALNRSVIDVELQSIAVESTRLNAPFAGVLVRVPTIVPGAVLLATETFDMVDPETIAFRMSADEVDLEHVQVGQEAVVSLDAYSTKSLRAVVSQIALQASDTSSGTVFPVWLRFLDPVSIEEERIGMNGEAELLLDRRDDVLAIPSDAITTTTDGTHQVRVMVGGKPEERTIELGLQTDDWTEVTGGLAEGDRVVMP